MYLLLYSMSWWELFARTVFIPMNSVLGGDKPQFMSFWAEQAEAQHPVCLSLAWWLIFFCSSLLTGSFQSAQLRTCTVKANCLVAYTDLDIGHQQLPLVSYPWITGISRWKVAVWASPCHTGQHPLVWIHTPTPNLLAGSELMSPHAAVPWAVTAGAELTTGVFTLSAVEACLDLSPCHSVFVFFWVLIWCLL